MGIFCNPSIQEVKAGGQMLKVILCKFETNQGYLRACFRRKGRRKSSSKSKELVRIKMLKSAKILRKEKLSIPEMRVTKFSLNYLKLVW